MKACWTGASGAAMLGMMAATPAVAGDKPLYQPVPAWVKPAPPVDAKAVPAGDAPVLLVLDRQERIEGGLLWSYADTVQRIATEQMLNDAGNVSITWQPDGGDLIVHHVEILRGGERIDVLARGAKFDVLRRESEIERLSMDGVLTATLAVEGLRVGDVLRLTTSSTNRDPTFAGAAQSLSPLIAAPAQARFGRYRLVWPKGDALRWRTYADAKPVITQRGGETELELALPLAKQPELPGDIPARLQRPLLIEATTFADWQHVGRVMAPLYTTEGTIKPDGALAQEVAAIAAASADPKVRAARALQVVQDKVRYFYRGMDHGNYRPQAPERTWEVRYGDCKAKSLLLLAMLRALGIEAEAVLASTRGGDAVPTRLTLPGVFDHVIVRATIAGASYWLDGTMLGTRLADLGDTPDFRWVLPVRAEGAALIAVPQRPNARPDMTIDLELDQSGGVRFPTVYKASVEMRGQMAAMMNQAISQGSKEQKDQMVAQLIGSVLEPGITVDRSVRYAADTGIATITATGLVTTQWKQQQQRYQMQLDRSVSKTDFTPDRARAAWQALPVATPPAGTLVVRTRVKLPDGGAGFVLEGDRTFADPVAGMRITRSVKQDGAWVTVEDRGETSGAEIIAATLPAERARVTAAKSRLLTVLAPAGIPSRTREAARARSAGYFKPILTTYARAIADDPEITFGYENRAAFLVGVYDYAGAAPDLDRLVALEPTAQRYLARSANHAKLGATAKALADAEKALELDPGSVGAKVWLATLLSEKGSTDRALALTDDAASGGEDGDALLSARADVLGDAGRGEEAVALFDAALKRKPGSPALLNGRCWTKAKASVLLDTALKDCTRAIELSEVTTAALDSRALTYVRLNRMEEALGDLDAALAAQPDLAESLFLRGVVRKRMGDATGAAGDFASARIIDPQIEATYRRLGLTS